MTPAKRRQAAAIARRAKALVPLDSDYLHCFDLPPLRTGTAPRRMLALLVPHAVERASERNITAQDLMLCLWLGLDRTPQHSDARVLRANDIAATVKRLSLDEAHAWARPGGGLGNHGLDSEARDRVRARLAEASSLGLDFTFYLVVTVFHVGSYDNAPAPQVYVNQRRR